MASVKMLRLVSNAPDGVVDLICPQDFVVPEHAEVCLKSLSCRPADKSFDVIPANDNVIWSAFSSRGDGNPSSVPYVGGEFPVGIVDDSNIDDALESLAVSMNRALTYDEFSIGNEVSWKLESDGNTTFSFSRWYDVGALTDGVATISQGITRQPGEIETFQRTAGAAEGSSYVCTTDVLPAGLAFVRCMVPGLTGVLFLGFSTSPIKDSVKQTDAMFGLLIADGSVSVITDGQVTLPSAATWDSETMYEVRRTGDSLTAWAFPEFKAPVQIGSHETTSSLYGLYFTEAGTGEDVSVSNARIVAKSTTGQQVSYTAHQALSATRDTPDVVSVRFASEDLANFLGFRGTVLGPAPGNTVSVTSAKPHAAYSALESIIVVCDQPFDFDCYNLVDYGDNAPSGRVSILATVTPEDPLTPPIVWSAQQYLWLPVHNKDEMMVRRFRFRLLAGDFTPIAMDGDTVLTILVRGGPDCADGHPVPKRVKSM